jgi:L-fuconolactonase
VIDTHTHFYDPTRPQGVPWPPKQDALLYRTVLPPDYLALPTPQKVTGTVVVEASPWVEDNQWVLDLAAQQPFIVGVVGNLPVGTKDFAAHLKRFAAHRLFRGLRLRGINLQTALEDGAFTADLKNLADRDLALDLVGGLDILDAADRIARLLPGQRIVLDHLAGVRVDGQAPPADWVRAMRRAAAHQNVFAKVSGLVEGTGRTDGSAPGDVEFYRPVLDTLWGLFGPERLIYGSNWPVSARFAPLGRVQGLVNDYFTAQGREALEKVFAGNAQTAYRWVKRGA